MKNSQIFVIWLSPSTTIRNKMKTTLGTIFLTNLRVNNIGNSQVCFVFRSPSWNADGGPCSSTMWNHHGQKKHPATLVVDQEQPLHPRRPNRRPACRRWVYNNPIESIHHLEPELRRRICAWIAEQKQKKYRN